MRKMSFVRIIKKISLVFLAFQMVVLNVCASGNVLSLYKNKPSDNIPFSVANMFPGDYIKQDYCVRVSYNGTITVYFTADIRPGYEKLAEVLKCKVVMPDERAILYDGLMRDIGDVSHTVSAVNTTEDLDYEIAVYLDTSVGNDYQDLELVADFKWWAEASEGGGNVPGGGGLPAGPDNPPIGPDNPPAEDKPSGELIDPPNTGDLANPVLLIVLICVSLFIIFLILFVKKKNKNEKNQTIKKLTICIVIIIVLAICLTITTFALVYSIVTVDENVFRTGTVQINLNDGKPIITEDEFLFEPGMTVHKEFFVKNESTDSVYYKVYLDKVKGGLAKVLEVKIIDNKTGDFLYEGNADDFTQENSISDELLLNEKRNLTAVFHYPKEAGNPTKNMTLEFDMCAVATQTRNNPNREFD